MNIESKVRILSHLVTIDSSGRHFTKLVSSDDLAALEADGLISITRPVHSRTGIEYGREHWSVEVTEEGVALVEVNPEYALKTYYISTDSFSQTVHAASLSEALVEFGEVPQTVTTAEEFREWLGGMGGYGSIQENGVEIVRVAS